MNKKLLLLFSLSLALSISTLAQKLYSLSVNGGYSWIGGAIGGDLQIGKFGISGGWMPCKMPISGDRVNSYSIGISMYSFSPDSKGFYASVGVTSAGHRREETIGGNITNRMTSPMTIVMVGIKSCYKDATFQIGCGYGWCQYIQNFTFEISLGYVLLSNIEM